jgi:hypothetical protein
MDRLEKAHRETRNYVGTIQKELNEALGKFEKSLGRFEQLSKETSERSSKVETALPALQKDTNSNTFWANAAKGTAGLLIAWLGFVTVQIFNMHGDIRAIKQAESINGTAIVGRLEKPSSIDQLKHYLAVTDAKLQLQRLNTNPKIKIEPASLKGLETALSQVTQRHPDLPEGWKVWETYAVALVDLQKGRVHWVQRGEVPLRKSSGTFRWAMGSGSYR